MMLRRPCQRLRSGRPWKGRRGREARHGFSVGGGEMTRRLFGTDGIRGRANEEPITANTVLALAMAAGAQFRHPGRHGLVVIGKDTRLSGYMLEPRSEERRVGKECRSRWSTGHEKKNMQRRIVGRADN